MFGPLISTPTGYWNKHYYLDDNDSSNCKRCNLKVLADF
jgi:hypothetical protein